MLDLVASPRQREFGLAKRDTLPRYCLECDVGFACHGGCPKHRFTTAPDGEPGLHYLCPRYKAFFGHIRPATAAMCQLLQAGRAPSELVSQCAAEDSRRPQRPPPLRIRPQMETVPPAHAWWLTAVSNTETIAPSSRSQRQVLPAAIFCCASLRAAFSACTWWPSASPTAFWRARVTAGSTFPAAERG